MGEESYEMHSEDDKGHLEKNKKRIVKTRAQVQALEKFYNEHKYPTEVLKIQLAESIGLTEKQVSGWFCHRRLKDKKLINEEKYATGVRQDRSSGVVQDRGSGHGQDSCGSTKQGAEDRKLDTREVESERLTPKQFSNADLTYEHGSQYAGNYNRTADVSSGSSSSSGSMSNHQNGVPFDAATPTYLVPKFRTDVIKCEKARPGPSGYLKVKGQVENPAITAVKRQLGKHYREDGPPLGVEFDPLPPGAFESDPVEEPCSGEAVLPTTSPDVSKMRQNPNFVKGREFTPSMAFDNPDMGHKTGRDYDIPESHTNKKFKPHASLPECGVYYPRRSNSTVSSREIPPSSEGRDGYGVKARPRVEVTRMDSFPSNRNLQLHVGKMREERSRKYNDVGPKVPLGENTENEYSNLTMKGNEYHGSGDRGLSRQIIKDGKTMYPDRRMINENQVKVPFKNDLIAPKRTREEFSQQQYLKRSSVMDNQPHKYQVMRSGAEMPTSSSEDDESAETSSSVD